MLRDKNKSIKPDVSSVIYEYTCDKCGCEIKFTVDELEEDNTYHSYLPYCPKCKARVKIWKKFPRLHNPNLFIR